MCVCAGGTMTLDQTRQLQILGWNPCTDDFVMGRANIARILGDLNYWHETLSTSIVDIIDRVTEMEIDKIRANYTITEA